MFPTNFSLSCNPEIIKRITAPNARERFSEVERSGFLSESIRMNSCQILSRKIARKALRSPAILYYCTIPFFCLKNCFNFPSSLLFLGNLSLYFFHLYIIKLLQSNFLLHLTVIFFSSHSQVRT